MDDSDVLVHGRITMKASKITVRNNNNHEMTPQDMPGIKNREKPYSRDTNISNLYLEQLILHRQ